MTNAPANLRKAAVLIRSLDADSAAVLLAQLSDSEAKVVRLAIRELGEIDPQERSDIRDALNVTSNDGTSNDGSVELELSAEHCRDSLSLPAAAADNDNDVGDEENDAPFAWLEGGDLPSLAAMLEREHLSTVAVVLSYLPAERASGLLAELPLGRRAAALERLADLGESDRASLEVIEKELADWIAQQKVEQRRKDDRLSSVKAILRHSSNEDSRNLLAEIAGRDRQLATRLGGVPSASPLPRPTPKRPAPKRSTIAAQAASLTGTPAPRRETMVPEPQFEFSRITALGRRDIAVLFQHCQAESVVLALAGASEEVTAHVESQLPRGVSKELRRRMHGLSTIRLADVTSAQKQIGKAAAQLILSGRLPKSLGTHSHSAKSLPARA